MLISAGQTRATKIPSYSNLIYLKRFPLRLSLKSTAVKSPGPEEDGLAFRGQSDPAGCAPDAVSMEVRNWRTSAKDAILAGQSQIITFLR